MKLYQCDCCGTSFGTNRLSPGKGQAGPNNWVSVRITALGRNVDKSIQQFDICPACRRILLTFLKGGNKQ